MACKSESEEIQFATFVILEMGTTGLPEKVDHQTKITELSLVAVNRKDVLAATPDTIAQVVEHKLTLRFNPEEDEIESTFDVTAFHAINSLFNNLAKPICLIAHNGHRFDFPILKKYLLELGVNFDSELRYADSLHGFFDIMEGHGIQHVTEGMANRYDVNRYWEPGNYIQNYSLLAVYKRTFPSQDFEDHERRRSALDRCFMVLKLFVYRAREMVEWFDTHNLLFSEVDLANVLL